METEKLFRKWDMLRTKDMIHYALFNGIITTLAFLAFITFFHSVSGGGTRIINDFSEYVFGCAGIFTGSVIGSRIGWNVKSNLYQEGDAVEEIINRAAVQCIINDKKMI